MPRYVGEDVVVVVYLDGGKASFEAGHSAKKFLHGRSSRRLIVRWKSSCVFACMRTTRPNNVRTPRGRSGDLL